VPPSIYCVARVPLREMEVATDATGTLERNAYMGGGAATLNFDVWTLQYVVVPWWRIGTMLFVGIPKEDAVTEVRKRLYERVVRDGTYVVKTGTDPQNYEVLQGRAGA